MVNIIIQGDTLHELKKTQDAIRYYIPNAEIKVAINDSLLEDIEDKLGWYFFESYTREFLQLWGMDVVYVIDRNLSL